jgi:hypothetical protein
VNVEVGGVGGGGAELGVLVCDSWREELAEAAGDLAARGVGLKRRVIAIVVVTEMIWYEVESLSGVSWRSVLVRSVIP